MAIILDYENVNQAVPYDDNIYHVLNNIQYLFKKQEKQLEYWKNRAREVEDEKWSDKEMVKLAIERDNAIQALKRGFGISEEEAEDVRKWQNHHIETQHCNCVGRGCIGGNFIYEFIPTSIGVIGSIYCKTCMDKIKKEYPDTDLTYSQLVAKYDAERIFRDV